MTRRFDALINFAKNWGYAGMCMRNLFAFRSTDPKDMKAADDPVGDENDRWLLEIAAQADLIIAAWGIHGSYRDRAKQVIKILPPLNCLGRGKGGDPLHPLYQPASRIPRPYQDQLD